MQVTGATPDDVLIASLDREGQLPAGRKHLCPRCDKALQEVSPVCDGGDGLLLDRCPARHGLWFDAGELARMLTMFPEQCRASKTIDYLNEILGDLSPKQR